VSGLVFHLPDDTVLPICPECGGTRWHFFGMTYMVSGHPESAETHRQRTCLSCGHVEFEV